MSNLVEKHCATVNKAWPRGVTVDTGQDLGGAHISCKGSRLKLNDAFAREGKEIPDLTCPTSDRVQRRLWLKGFPALSGVGQAT